MVVTHHRACSVCFGSSSGTRTRTCSSSPTGPIALTAAPRTSVRLSYFLFLISYLIMISNNHRSTLAWRWNFRLAAGLLCRLQGLPARVRQVVRAPQRPRLRPLPHRPPRAQGRVGTVWRLLAAYPPGNLMPTRIQLETNMNAEITSSNLLRQSFDHTSYVPGAHDRTQPGPHPGGAQRVGHPRW